MRRSLFTGWSGRALAPCAVLTAAAGIALAVQGQAAYADRISPVWAPLVGALLALMCVAATRRRRLWCIAATVFLLPPTMAGVFHALRVLGAIPLPVDWLALVGSVGAALTLWAAWALCDPLRSGNGRPLQTPRWVALAGLCAALAYPVLKTLWLVGLDWLTPHGVSHRVDAAYAVPVALALLGGAATVVALRWWDAPAPTWAHPAAATGGLMLVGLGACGVNATLTTATAEGPALGAVVYGSWLLWGLATLAVAARLSPARGAPVASRAAPLAR
ncbi:hypothetical protein [Zhihengliuella sp.]|uniref:hypothetical protein n=1 Tax=Zhihengliuella sp. TaxID=1954483 RepID=UPI00281247FB|nr:hypothetical protein [Zhihengliuella sp.]